MFCSDVAIVEDGSLNGNVQHMLLYTTPPSVNYTFRSSSFGKGHPKHQLDITQSGSYGVAGEDVYGHRNKSIFVADGHGKHGLQAAISAVALEQHIYMPSLTKIISNPKQAEKDIRDSVVQYISDSQFEYSGSTFAFMNLLEDNGRRVVVTVNIGDSEALLIYKNNIHRTSCAHSWDDFTVYKRYCNSVLRPKNVCYNRWNASRHMMRDMNGEHRPLMLYQHTENGPRIHQENAKWISELYVRKKDIGLEHGTQSVRVPNEPYENWGSSVLLYGRARGQNMATIGDTTERSQTEVPIHMVHVYIHEIPPDEHVVALVQSDGVSNSRTLSDCGLCALSCKNAQDYIKSIKNQRDDMSVSMFWSEPRFHI